MKLLNSILASTILCASVNIQAENDIYGYVKQLITRSGEGGDTSIYFRLDVMENISHVESCVVDLQNLVWFIDPNSAVASYQYKLIEKSYIEKLPVRVIGQSDVCSDGTVVYRDHVFELSPWSWQNQ